MIRYTVIDGDHRSTFSDYATAKAFARERAGLPTWSGTVRIDDGWYSLYEIYVNLRPGGPAVLEVEGETIREYEGPTCPGRVESPE